MDTWRGLRYLMKSLPLPRFFSRRLHFPPPSPEPPAGCANETEARASQAAGPGTAPGWPNAREGTPVEPPEDASCTPPALSAALPRLAARPVRTRAAILRRTPYVSDHPLKVCPQHFLDHRRRLPARLQFGGDHLHVIGTVQVRHVGIAVLARRPDCQRFPASDIFIEPLLLFRCQRHRLNRAIRTNAHMVCTADVESAQNMIDHVIAS